VRPASGWQVIEGAGGLLSPLAEDGDAADLARMLDLPVILVAACRLGGVHQVRIVAEYAWLSRLDVRCVVVNRLRPPGDLAEDTLADEIRRWVDRPVVEVPFGSSDLPEAALR
jgi:dethiobiotin synthetase